MSNRLGGKQGTAYLGTNANQPPNYAFETRAPTSTDIGYSVGDFWLHDFNDGTNTQVLYYLSSLQGDSQSKGPIAQWVALLTGTGIATSFLTDVGGVATPVGGVLKILGSTNITTTTAPADQININLNNTVHISGSFTADGNITAGTDIHAMNDLMVDGLTTLNAGLTITGGAITLPIGPGSLYADNGGVVSAINTGAAGTILTSNGVGVAPSWQAPGGGGGGTTSFVTEVAGPALPDGGGALTVTGAPLGFIETDGTTANTLTINPGAASAVNGRLYIGGVSGGNWATLTAGAGIAVANADGAITITAAGAPNTGLVTAHTDSGDAAVDAFNAITWAGSAVPGLITTSGAGNTVTIDQQTDPTISGTVTLSSLGVGAVLSDATGELSSLQGTANQFLMAKGGATLPIWGDIAAGDASIIITPVASGINITASGTASVTGTANQITASAGPNVVLSTPATFIAPGSIASTTSLTAGNAFTVTAGAITLTPLSTSGMVRNNAAGVISTTATTDHAIQLGNASGQLTSFSLGTAGQLLASAGAGADPVWTTSSFPITATQGDIIYASAANTWSNLAKDTNATRYLSNTGVSNNPAWAQVNLANGVTSTLPVANGGTGNTTFTPYSVICAGTLATGPFQNVVGVGTANQVLVSNGAGALPSWQAVPATAGVTSIAGTANQITASAATGAVTLSIPATFIAPGSIAATTSLTVGTTLLNVRTTGEVTMSGQPAFLAYLGTNDLNVTGNGAIYTFGSGNALTEVFDQGNDFNTNGTFTAPVTGIYAFSATLHVDGITGAMNNGVIRLVTTGRTFTSNRINAGAARTNLNALDFSINVAAVNMTAGDTAIITLTLFNGAGNTAFVEGAAPTQSHFSGHLVC